MAALFPPPNVGVAHPEARWRALTRVTLCSWRIASIIQTTLALSVLESRYPQRPVSHPRTPPWGAVLPDLWCRTFQM
ncbi:hypothetical protein GCM10023225_03410 [Kineococcus glutinatus]|uniref:Uncharacterized protein n=1 Tax=Kineococcus glutinatus TaxID=1070872 RepID=A0ABP9H7W7_9ACTN